MNGHNLNVLLRELTVLSGESEWVEFKCSYVDPAEIGQYLSAIANAAALHRKEKGFLIWSRIIAETIKTGLMKPADPANKSKKHAKYVPFWL